MKQCSPANHAVRNIRISNSQLIHCWYSPRLALVLVGLVISISLIDLVYFDRIQRKQRWSKHSSSGRRDKIFSM